MCQQQRRWWRAPPPGSKVQAVIKIRESERLGEKRRRRRACNIYGEIERKIEYLVVGSAVGEFEYGCRQ